SDLTDFSAENWETESKSTKSLEWWYKYTFVDTEDLTVQQAALRQKLLEDASYLRWADYGTYYGVTDYSFVLLTDTLPNLKQPGVNASFLLTHLQTIYFRLVELTLVQRACVQRFSDDITHISRLEDEREEEIAQQANALYRRYIRFVNRIYFREVTAQTQGIELYDLLQKQSRLRDSVESLNSELRELNTFTQQVYEQKRVEQEREKLKIAQHEAKLKADERERSEKKNQRREEQLDQLTVIGAVIAAPSLLYSLLALLDLPGDYGTECAWTTYSISVVASMIAIFLALKAFRTYRLNTGIDEHVKKPTLSWPLYVIFLAALLFGTPVLIQSFASCQKATASTTPQKSASPTTISDTIPDNTFEQPLDTLPLTPDSTNQ
ncbi:MAG: hypothetical protein AAGJ93_17985, partial [Bacteroidota bacterium]